MKKLFRYMLWFLIILLLAVFIIFGGFLVYATINDFKPAPREKILSLPSSPEEIPAGQTFSVLSWNIGYGGLSEDMDFFYDGGERVRPGKGRYADNINSMVNFVKDRDTIHFWLFQEVDLNSKRSYHDNQLIRIQSALRGHRKYFAPNYIVKFVPLPLGNSMGKVNSGLLSMLSHEPDSTYRMSFDKNYRWPMSLFMPDRCFMLHRFGIAGYGQELIIINTHNSAFDDGSLRKQQLSKLKKFMIEEYRKGNYVLVGGDWNMNPPGFNEGAISTGDAMMNINPSIEIDFFPDNWNILYDENIPTNRDLSQPYILGVTKTTIIDFFICSPNIEPLNIKTFNLGFSYSDHNPVMLRFKMLPEGYDRD